MSSSFDGGSTQSHRSSNHRANHNSQTMNHTRSNNDRPLHNHSGISETASAAAQRPSREDHRPPRERVARPAAPRSMHQPHGVSAIGPSGSNISSATYMSHSVSNQQHQYTVESPLPPMVQRSLGDRSNEKRKNAALEIEALVKTLQEANNLSMIQSVITVLSKDFCTSMNSNYRKGGLVGLAATAIGLAHNSRNFLDVLLPPVLHCFDDPEPRVRYYACESLYNIAKVSRHYILEYFNQVFEGLTKLYADVEPDVKNGAQLLDRLIKDIVMEADESFDIELFLPILQNYIRRTNPFIRGLICSWLTLLDSQPNISMLDYLPDFLDGLFNMLTDTSMEIRQSADSALSEFLRELTVSTVVEFGPIVSILVIQCQSKVPLNRVTAISWLAQLIHHPFAGGDALLPFHAEILNAIMGCISDVEKDIKPLAERTNNNLLNLVRDTKASFELKELLETLTRQLLEKEDVPTKMAALKWINMLLSKRKTDMSNYIERLLPVLLRTLSDQSDAVVLLNLQVLSRISLVQKSEKGELAGETEEIQFQLVLNAILNLFAQDRELLETRGSLIIRKLCVLLNAKNVYIRMAETLSSYEYVDGQPADAASLQFVSTMVQTLNLILLTAPELQDLRSLLASSWRGPDNRFGVPGIGHLRKQNDGPAVFRTLFHCWSHNPVSTFSLCLLAQAYDLSFALIQRFSQMAEITVGFLLSVERTVLLLESPIFCHLRLNCLDVGSELHAPLLKSLYGLLMCLPQGDAFRLLNDRLTTICNLRDNLGMSPMPLDLHAKSSTSPQASSIKSNQMEKLLKRFDEILALHRKAKERSLKLAVQQEQSKLQSISLSASITGHVSDTMQGNSGKAPPVATSNNQTGTTSAPKKPGSSVDKRVYAHSSM